MRLSFKTPDHPTPQLPDINAQAILGTHQCAASRAVEFQD